MSASSRVRYLIEVVPERSDLEIGFVHAPIRPLTFEFQSRDIGFTQGTTIIFQSQVIVQYRPGTRHWDRALEIAEELVRKTVERMGDAFGSWSTGALTLELTKVLKEDDCTPWDGNDVWAEEDGN